jgi:hypothetical protein
LNHLRQAFGSRAVFAKTISRFCHSEARSTGDNAALLNDNVLGILKLHHYAAFDTTSLSIRLAGHYRSGFMSRVPHLSLLKGGILRTRSAWDFS